MKSCPTCNRTFPDDTLGFCLVDGSILSAPYDSATTSPSTPARHTNSPATEVLNPGASRDSLPATQAAAPRDLRSTIAAPLQPPPFNEQPPYAAQMPSHLQTASYGPSKSSNGKKILVAGGLLVALLVAVFALLMIFGPHASNIQNNLPRSADARTNPETKPATLNDDEAKTREQLRTDPDNAELNRHLSETLRYEGKLTLSEQFARRAVGLNPNSSATHYTLAAVLKEENKKADSDGEKKLADKLAAKGK